MIFSPMIRNGLLAAACAAASSLAYAETLDLAIGSDSAAVDLSGPMRGGRGNAAYDLGFLFSDDQNVDFKQAHAALMVTGDAGASNANINAGLGVRAAGADFDGGSGGAIDLGGKVEMRVPDFNRLGLNVYVWYAPEVITFGDFEDNLEFGAFVDYQVIRDASLFVGYREVRWSIEGVGEDKVDDGVIAGLRLNF